MRAAQNIYIQANQKLATFPSQSLTHSLLLGHTLEKAWGLEIIFLPFGPGKPTVPGNPGAPEIPSEPWKK